MKRQNDLPPDPEREDLEHQLEALRRDIRRLKLEQDLLKKANEILKKDLGINRQLLTNREKTLLVDALRQTYTLAELVGFYLDSERWAREVLEERAQQPGWPRDLTLVIAAAFDAYQRGATDYEP